MRFRKKPVEIDAIQWTGGNYWDVNEFTDGNFQGVEPEDRTDDPDINAEVFDTLHSTWVGVKSGQWIIRGVKGEFYPCDPGVFRQTYEPVIRSGGVDLVFGSDGNLRPGDVTRPAATEELDPRDEPGEDLSEEYERGLATGLRLCAERDQAATVAYQSASRWQERAERAEEWGRINEKAARDLSAKLAKVRERAEGAELQVSMARGDKYEVRDARFNEMALREVEAKLAKVRERLDHVTGTDDAIALAYDLRRIVDGETE